MSVQPTGCGICFKKYVKYTIICNTRNPLFFTLYFIYLGIYYHCFDLICLSIPSSLCSVYYIYFCLHKKIITSTEIIGKKSIPFSIQVLNGCARQERKVFTAKILQHKSNISCCFQEFVYYCIILYNIFLCFYFGVFACKRLFSGYLRNQNVSFMLLIFVLLCKLDNCLLQNTPSKTGNMIVYLRPH